MNVLKGRRPLYLQLIAEKKLLPGYPCDQTAGLYFENDQLKTIVTRDPADKAYCVHLENGRAAEKLLLSKLIS